MLLVFGGSEMSAALAGDEPYLWVCVNGVNEVNGVGGVVEVGGGDKTGG